MQRGAGVPRCRLQHFALKSQPNHGQSATITAFHFSDKEEPEWRTEPTDSWLLEKVMSQMIRQFLLQKLSIPSSLATYPAFPPPVPASFPVLPVACQFGVFLLLCSMQLVCFNLNTAIRMATAARGLVSVITVTVTKLVQPMALHIGCHKTFSCLRLKQPKPFPLSLHLLYMLVPVVGPLIRLNLVYSTHHPGSCKVPALARYNDLPGGHVLERLILDWLG